MDTDSPVAIAAAAEKDRIANLKGIAFMGVAAALVSVMHVLVRDLSSEINPIQIAFYRNVIGFMMLFPFLLRQDRSLWITKQQKLQFFRAIIGTCALLSWFTALGMMPVGDATAISCVTVLFVTIGAAVVLKEKVGMRRWAAILVGFIGTRIGIRDHQPGGRLNTTIRPIPSARVRHTRRKLAIRMLKYQPRSLTPYRGGIGILVVSVVTRGAAWTSRRDRGGVGVWVGVNKVIRAVNSRGQAIRFVKTTRGIENHTNQRGDFRVDRCR